MAEPRLAACLSLARPTASLIRFSFFTAGDLFLQRQLVLQLTTTRSTAHNHVLYSAAHSNYTMPQIDQPQQLGVTPPISVSLPTEEENKANTALLEELRAQGTFESPADTEKRLVFLNSKPGQPAKAASQSSNPKSNKTNPVQTQSPSLPPANMRRIRAPSRRQTPP